MCSIVGGIVANKTNVSRILNIAEHALTRKGYDGFSINIVNDYNGEEASHTETTTSNSIEVLNILKNACNNGPFSFLMFGRATPETEEQATNLNMIQPFSFEDVITAHHGLISNYEEIKQDLSNTEIKLQTNIDSEVVPWYIHNLIEEQYKNKWDMHETQQRFGHIIKGSHAILSLDRFDGKMFYVNNYLGLWCQNLSDELFKLNSYNDNFIVYNTDLSQLYPEQFELPLYSAGVLGSLF